MIKSLVESTFQRASVAQDYDELTVSVGKLRTQLNDLRHVMRDMHQEMERLRGQVNELSGLKAELAALRSGGVVLAQAAAPVHATPVVPPAQVAAASAHSEEEAVLAEPAPAAEIAPITMQGIAAAIAQASSSGPPPVAEPDFGIRTAPDGALFWGPLDNPSARARAAGKTLIIDQLECISCGTCVEQTDAVFILPDDSKAVARTQEGPMDAIQDAIDACPVTCIHWTENPAQFTPLNDETGRKLAS